MRALAIILAIVCGGCGTAPSEDWRNAVAAVERSVELPEGAGALTCYERHYVLLSQREAQAYLQLPHTARLEKGLLVGVYVRPADPEALVGKQGRYPATSLASLPGTGVEDRGCSVLTVLYAIGSGPGAVPATCGVTWDGDFPHRLSPAARC